MFNEKMLGNLVLANLVIAVAVLLMSVTIVVKGFAPSAAVADNDAPAAVAQAQPQPAADNEAISKKYAKRSMSLEKAISKRKLVKMVNSYLKDKLPSEQRFYIEQIMKQE